MAIQPSDYLNRAALGANIAKNWALSFSNYTVNFCNMADFEALHVDFSAQATLNNQMDIDKKENTEKLKAVNSTITKSITRLKEYLRDEYPVNTDSQYAAYGLEKDARGRYIFPSDNDSREACLARLLLKLQTAGDPIKAKKQGLAYWQPLIVTHATEWAASKAIKSQKAAAASACIDFYKQSGEWIGKLHKQISIDFSKDKVASTRRTFGFLNETYK